MFGLLPFICATVIVVTATENAHFTKPSVWWLMWVSVAAWALLSPLFSGLIAQRARHRWLARYELGAQALLVGWFAALCYGWGWTTVVPGTFLALLPFVMMMAIHWWNLAVPVRVITGHHWTRGGMLLHHLRLSALPILLVTNLLIDLGRPLEHYFQSPAMQVLGIVLMEVAMVLAFILAPPLLVWMWGGKPLPEGAVSDRLRAVCVQCGVGVRHLLRWPVPGGRMHNAAVVGAHPRLRYVLFTDDLLRDLDEDKLVAVIGHELGHARHGHLWIYFIFANVSLLAAHVFSTDVIDSRWLSSVPGWDGLSADMQQGALTVVFLIIGWRFVFGALSRACERQADLVGAELSGSIGTMQDALKTVARLSGQPENAPNWRHYSIAQRVEFLERVRHHPELASFHHRMIGSLKLTLVMLLALLVLSLAAFQFSPMRHAQGVNAHTFLTQLRSEDADLDRALRQADAGDGTELAQWYARTDELGRQRLLSLHLNLNLTEPEDSDQPLIFDERADYRLRNRLRAFANVSSGDREFDTALDNQLAYILVAGTEHPTAADLTQAKSLLPRLEEAVKHRPNSGVFDTIACVRFATGDYAGAVRDQRQALDLLAKEPLKRERDRRTAATGQRLFQARLEAAEANLALGAGGQPRPLPLTWTLDAVSAPAPAASEPKPEAVTP